MTTGEKPLIYRQSLATVYPHHVAMAEKKGRSRAEVDEIIRRLTGYTAPQPTEILDDGTDFEGVFVNAPAPIPNRRLISGVVCGVRVEDVGEPTMQEIRYLDKLIDELARDTATEKILRTP